MKKKKAVKSKSEMKRVSKSKGRLTDDFKLNDKGQSYAQNLDEKNPKLAKVAERKVRAR